MFKLLIYPHLVVVWLLAALTLPVWAQTTANRIQQSQTQIKSSTQSATGLDANDVLLAQIWGLSNEEMARAKVLLKGPRASFSVANLSPIEALGIHARSETERRKYAEMFARAFRLDVERSLAWDRAFTAAMARLYPNSAVIDYRGLPKVTVPVGAADVANVPRTQINDPAALAQPRLTPAAGGQP